MITMDPPLVPALRFGRILEARREELGLNIQQVAAELGVHLTADVVADIEAGRRDLSDAELVQISNVYGIDVEKVLPNRAELVIDLDSGLITAGGKQTTTEIGTDIVLERYLGLVYTLRDIDLGTKLHLRDDDIEVLSDALDLSSDETFSRLTDLQLRPDDLAPFTRRVKNRLIVPAAGIFVAAVGLGSLVLVGGDAEAQPDGPGAAIGAATTPVADTEVELIPPLVAERDSVGGQITTYTLGD